MAWSMPTVVDALLNTPRRIPADETWSNNPKFAQGMTGFVIFSRPVHRVAIFLLVVVASLVALLAPWLQKMFIDGLLGAPQLQPMGLDATTALLWLVFFSFLAMVAAQFLNALVRVLCSRESAVTQAVLSRALYRHTLQLTAKARGGRSVGDTVNLYTQDVSAVVALVDEFLPGIITSVTPLFLAPVFVSYFFDIPLTAVLMVSLGFLTMLVLMSWRQSSFFAAFKRLAGERLAVVNEWLQNIRIIRVLGWTSHFEQKIYDKRCAETNNRLGMVTNGSTMNSISQVAPLLINATGVAALVSFKGSATTAGDIFALLWVFGVFLSRPLRNIPWTLVMFLDGWTSARRLERFFALDSESSDAVEKPVDPRSESVLRDPKASELQGAPPNALGLRIQDLSLSYGGKSVLTGLDLDVSPGSFVAITGEVGSGKTQLLLSLLREAPARFDSYHLGKNDVRSLSLANLRAAFSYVPQDGFVMSASLRENIIFAYDNHGEHAADLQVREALQLADFRLNEEVAGGLDTEIGERGVNLSGGQRQRVSLARGWYHQAPIILLDDCLSAVDVETEKLLLERLILGAWRHKTRILVTHRLSVLPFADVVYRLEGGRLHRASNAPGRGGSI